MSLLTGPRTPSTTAPDPTDDTEVRPGRGDYAHRRPLAAVALLGGATAALGPLLVCLALGVTGWFLTDAGAHGTSTDGMRVGAVAWLMAHGSGLYVGATPIALVPLGLTVVCAWVVWRLGVRVGESVSGHGPDAHALADGERDWTVPIATTLFGSAYVAVAVVTSVAAGTPTLRLSSERVVLWSVALTLLVAAPAVATGSGRAAVWFSWLPTPALAVLVGAARTVLLFGAASALTVVAMLGLHFDLAANVLSGLHVDAGDAALVTLLGAAVTPNAVLFAGAYLLGPGFTIGAGTLVSPTVSAVGPLPAFPLLAALPANGPTPGWTVGLMAVPFVVAAAAVVRTHRRFPTDRWEEGALRGTAAGLLAGLVVTVLSALAGGSIGPGRMQQVAPHVLDVLVHGLASFGLGGLVAGLAMTWWTRRHLEPYDEAVQDAEPAS